MKLYQPYGGGVNSLALKLLLIEQGRDCLSLFVNHGGDNPKTYTHVQKMSQVFDLVEIKPDVQGYSNIYDYYFDQRLVPMVFLGRSCTDKFKKTPQRRFYKARGEPYKLLIGFDAGEKKRANIPSKLKHVSFAYPLIEAGLNRKACKKLILENGFVVPPRSDCFFCPFHSKEGWFKLARDDPDLFWKAVKLDENSDGPRLLKHGGNLRDLWPPPSTFEDIDTRCGKCVFGVI